MYIHELAANGLTKTGHHGPRRRRWACPASELPQWDDIQFVTAQLARLPLLDDEPVGTEVCIGPNADKPLWLDIPLFVSDMSFGALSQEAKTALARGAELAGTGICSGEGGMLPEEQAENSRYFYELASARFGWIVGRADEGAGVPLQGRPGRQDRHRRPSARRQGRRHASPRCAGLPEGTAAVSPPTLPRLALRRRLPALRRRGARAQSGGIPIGFKLSAQHIEDDIDAALEVGVDYVILDGRGGGTGAAPLLFRDNISVPTIPALARARAPPRPARPARRHARDHRRPAPRARLRQGARARRRRGRGRELRDPGHRLPRHAGVPHQQLPGRHRHPEAAPAGPAARSTRPRTGSTGSCGPRSSSCRCWPGPAATRT